VRKRVVVLGGVATAVLGAIVIIAASVLHEAQRADYGWDPGIEQPTFASEHPRVVVDQAHHNASTAGIGGRYWAFGRLLRADGYDVRKGAGPLSATSFEDVDVLVIANASGASKPQFLGINLPVRSKGSRDDPAFSAGEVEAVRAWVERGGSLLLIADHAPFGAAAEALGAAFGVTMHKGFVELTDELSDPLLFARENGRLGEHPILAGHGPDTAVNRVMTFTGQSLDGPADAAVLLKLPGNAVEYVPDGSELVPQPAGAAQGLALEYGQGRAVVLGEAGMLTAQVAKGEPFGMNLPGNDNRQLALNIMHWLSRRL
jgi:hypothetical protein